MKQYGLIKFPDQAYGFFSNFFSVLTTIQESLNQNLTPYVDLSNTWFNSTYNLETDTVGDLSINPWDWWFVQSKEEDLVPITLNQTGINHEANAFFSNSNISYYRDLADKYCIIQPSILEKEKEFAKWYLEGKTTLGIMARGTEFLTHLDSDHPGTSINAWPKLIEDCLNKHPDINNIFLVSEDRRIIENILEVYPQTRYLPHCFRMTTQTEDDFVGNPWWLTPPIEDPNHKKRLGEECLIQTHLLGRCQYFLGTNSGITNGAYFFNKIPFKKFYLV